MLKPPRLRPRDSASAVVFLPCRVLVGPDGGGIQHEPIQVRFLQGLKDLLPHALAGPAAEALVDGVPGAEALGKVPPGGAAAGNPEHGVDKLAVVSGCAPHIAGLAWEQRGKALPIIVTDFVASHKLFEYLTTTTKNHSVIVNTT